jgi:monothiol glutaredoxin
MDLPLDFPGVARCGQAVHGIEFRSKRRHISYPEAAASLPALIAPTRQTIMSRSILDEAHLHPAIRETIAGSNADIVGEVQSAIAANPVVVVGMAQNPFPRKAREALDAVGTPYKYLEYGSYLGGWRRRNALKMWTGWPTFPMVFVKGAVVGGASELQRLIDSGESPRMLAG